MLIRSRWSIHSFIYHTWRSHLLLLAVTAFTSFLYQQWPSPVLQVPPMIVTVLGTAIAFFIGFINNQAYDRWWEARKIWGLLLNDSRSWSRDVLTYIDVAQPENQERQHQLSQRQLAFLHALVATLRRTEDKTYQNFLSPQEQDYVLNFASIPSAILRLQAQDLQDLVKRGQLDGFHFQQMDQLLRQFTTHLGGAERIKNTVFPATYVYFTQLFIWIFIILCTITLANSLGYWSCLFTWLIGFVYLVAYRNGQAIMNPFENGRNDTPMNTIVRTAEINLLQDLGQPDLPSPLQPIQGDYLL